MTGAMARGKVSRGQPDLYLIVCMTSLVAVGLY
jgi:hypothetical protein